MFEECENWLFETKQFRAIRADKVGDRYTATALITIANGTVFVENLMADSEHPFTRQDVLAIKKFLTDKGYSKAKWIRKKNNKTIEKSKEK